MENQLTSFIEGLKLDRRIDSFDEAATKQAVVTRLLSLLGLSQSTTGRKTG
jgi:hypothetical protein